MQEGLGRYERFHTNPNFGNNPVTTPAIAGLVAQTLRASKELLFFRVSRFRGSVCCQGLHQELCKLGTDSACLFDNDLIQLRLFVSCTCRL